MRLTNVEVLQAQAALTKLIEIKLPIKTSFDIALVTNLVEQQVKAFVLVRDKLFKTYNITTEQGKTDGPVKFKCMEEGKEEENLTAFGDEFNELLETKTEELPINKIKLPSNVEIEPAILVPLTKLVEVE